MTDSSPDNKAGRAMLWLAAVGLLAGLTILFQVSQTGTGSLVQSKSESGRSMIVLKRDRSGHYLTKGEINGQSMLFLVDTGATDVAIPASTARELNLDFGPEVTVMTAGGPVRAWRTRLDSVSVGSIELTNVRATITQGPLNEVLLGMSFLQYFTIRQQGDELTIETGNQDDD